MKEETKYIDNNFHQFILEIIHKSIPEIFRENWNDVMLFIKLQPGTVGLNGYFFSENKKEWLVPNLGYEGTLKVLEYHKKRTKNGALKWNKLEVSLSNDKMNIEYIWDDIYQSEVDKCNLEIKAKNPNYQIPLWPWEEQIAK